MLLSCIVNTGLPRDRNHNSTFSTLRMDGANELVLRCTRPERHATDKHPSILDLFVSDEEKVVL